MKTTYKLITIVVATLLLGAMAANLAMGAVTTSSGSKAKAVNANTIADTSNVDGAVPPVATPNLDKLKQLVPKTAEDAENRIMPVRTRFLMWTNDGRHIMWGICGNGFFTGTDNLGKRCWGIYGNGIFAGFYDGDFFWGKYYNGAWKAYGLFGLRYSQGQYVLFPQPTITNQVPP